MIPLAVAMVGVTAAAVTAAGGYGALVGASRLRYGNLRRRAPAAVSTWLPPSYVSPGWASSGWPSSGR